MHTIGTDLTALWWENLRSLYFAAGRSTEIVDLAHLPPIEAFEGYVVRSVASVLRNPNLRFMEVFGSIPKSFVRRAGPLYNLRAAASARG